MAHLRVLRWSVPTALCWIAASRGEGEGTVMSGGGSRERQPCGPWWRLWEGRSLMLSMRCCPPWYDCVHVRGCGSDVC